MDGTLVHDIAGVERRLRLEQDDLTFVTFRYGKVLDTTRGDDELTGADPDAAVPKPHEKSSLVNEEQFVFVIVVMPHELALELGELDLHVIDLAGNLRAPMIREHRRQPNKP